MRTIKANLTRTTSRLVPTEILKSHVRFLADMVLKRAPGWQATRHRSENPVPVPKGWKYSIGLTFQAVESRASEEDARLALAEAARDQKFKGNPYYWDEAPLTLKSSAKPSKKTDQDDGLPLVDDVDEDNIIEPHQLVIPRSLFKDDGAIANSPYFRNIIGRDPHIRQGLRAIDAFRTTSEFIRGKNASIDPSRSHVLYWGPPAGGKSLILRGIRKLLGPGAFFEIDAPNTSKAGLLKLFQNKFRKGCPPVALVEEIEKVPTEVLTGWLNLLDKRAEMSKVNFFTNDRVKVNFICIATCNDKEHLDTVIKGALGSRFGHQVYVPRPNETEMESILLNRVNEIGGDPEWVSVCLGLMQEFQTDDPRKIESWLDYGDALLDNSAVKELRAIYAREQHDRSASRLAAPVLSFNLDPEASDEYNASLIDFHKRNGSDEEPVYKRNRRR